MPSDISAVDLLRRLTPDIIFFDEDAPLPCYQFEAGKRPVNREMQTADLFKDSVELDECIDILGVLVDTLRDSSGAPMLKGLRSMIADLLDDDVPNSDIDPLEYAVRNIEAYIKVLGPLALPDSAVILQEAQEKRKGLDWVTTRFQTFTDSRNPGDTRKGIFDIKARPLFEGLQALRNLTTHHNRTDSPDNATENSSASRPVKYITARNRADIAIMLVTFLLHIIAYRLSNFRAATTRSRASSRRGPDPEAEKHSIAGYVAKAHANYHRFLADNVGTIPGNSGVHLLPVRIRRFNIGTEEDSHAADVSELTEADRGIYVTLGAPGAGKTTFLNHLLSRMCEIEQTEESPIPMLISIAAIYPGQTLRQVVNNAFLEKGIDEKLGEKILASGRFVLALDGLNEFQSREMIPGFISQVYDMSVSYPCRILMTGRIYEFETIKPYIKKGSEIGFYRIEGTRLDDIRNYVTSLGLAEKALATMEKMYNNDSIIKLMSSPLNFSIIIRMVAEDFRPLQATNRGQLLRHFLDGVLEHEETKNPDVAGNRADYLLQELAIMMHGRNENMMTLEEINNHLNNILTPQGKPYYGQGTAGLLESAARAGILTRINPGADDDNRLGYAFRVDTFQEFFLAKAKARYFIHTETESKRPWLGRSVPPVLDVRDQANYETLQLILELIDNATVCRNTLYRYFDEKMEGRQISDEIPVQNLMLSTIFWSAGLANTLPYETAEDGTPGARMLVESWILNHIRILFFQLAEMGETEATHSLIFSIPGSCASLSTRRCYRRLLTSEIAELCSPGELERISRYLIRYCSDVAMLYDVLSELIAPLHNDGGKYYRLLSTTLVELFASLNPLSLEVLHLHLSELVNSGKPQPSNIIRDYYRTAFLLASPKRLETLDYDRMTREKINIPDFEYHNILALHVSDPGWLEKFLLSAPIMSILRYRKSLLPFVLRYLIFHNAIEFAVRLMGKPGIRQLLRDLNMERAMYNLLPIHLITDEMARNIYDPEMLASVREMNARTSPWIKMDEPDEELERFYTKGSKYFLSVLNDRERTGLRTRVIGYDNGVLQLWIEEIVNIEHPVGKMATVTGPNLKFTGQTRYCIPFRQPFHEIEFHALRPETLPISGTLTWQSGDGTRQGRIPYSMLIAGNENFRLRFTKREALQAFQSENVRKFLRASDTTFKIGNTFLTPVQYTPFPHAHYGYVIGIDCPKPLPNVVNSGFVKFTDKNGSDINLKMKCPWQAQEGEIKGTPILYATGNNRVWYAFPSEKLIYAAPPAYLSLQGVAYRVPVTSKCKVFKQMLTIRGVRFSSSIFFIGRMQIEGSEQKPLQYYARPVEGTNTFDLSLGGTAEGIESFRDSFLKSYGKYKRPSLLVSAGGGDSVVTVQEFGEISEMGPVVMVSADLTGIPDAEAASWLQPVAPKACLPCDVNNQTPGRSNRFSASSIPFIRKTAASGKTFALIPKPINADKLAAQSRVTFQGLPCTIKPGRTFESEKDTCVQDDHIERMSLLIYYRNTLVNLKTNDVIQLNDGFKAEFAYLHPLVNWQRYTRYHSDIARPLLDEIVKFNIPVDCHKVRFFNMINQAHLLLEDPKMRETVLRIKSNTREPLLHIARVVSAEADITHVRTADGKRTCTPHTGGGNLKAGDFVLISPRGHLFPLGSDLSNCNVFKPNDEL